jgi:hypothetical protein
MTYNFDPERWFEREQTVLEMKRQRGDLSEEEFAAAANPHFSPTICCGLRCTIPSSAFLNLPSAM